MPAALEPILLYFPLALLSFGAIAEMAMHFKPNQRRWLFPASSAALWLGTAVLLAAGLNAIGKAPPTDQRFLLWWSSALFCGLAFWRWQGVHRVQAVFGIAWLGALIPLWAGVMRDPRPFLSLLP